MNSFLFRTLVVAAALFFSVTAASTVSAANNRKNSPTSGTGKNSIDFSRIKSRIDALLTQRLKPAPLPETLPNPFQLTEIAPPVTQSATETVAVTSDSEMLLYYGAMLKISGTVRINDQTHLVINQAPYKEGDVFTLKTKDATAKLRVVRIAPGELTLGLNDTVQVIKFKK